MEDPDLADEWAIQEYSSEEESGKLSWIVRNGLSLGKKVLVTGFVISSAPLVLPPLVVISVIGFACSVPSGLFLASYVCTDKLMSKLLPGSTPPCFFLDCGTQYSDEEVENNREDVGLEGLIDMGKEEELVDEKEKDEIDGGKCFVGDGHEQADFFVKNVQELKKDVNEIAEENGYQEYVGDYEDEMEEQAEGIEVKIESIREPKIDESSGQLLVDEVHAAAGAEISGRTIEEEGAPAFEVRNVVIELSQNRDTEEDQELARETRGLLEKIREEGMTDNGDEEKQSFEKLSVVTEEGDRKVEEIRMPSENKNDYGNVRIEKLLREIEHKIEEKIDEPKGCSTGSVDVVPEVRKPIEPIEDLLGKRDGDNILETEKSKGGTTDASSASKKPKVEKLYVLEEGRANENITKNVQDYQMNKEKEIVITTNDNTNDASRQYSYAYRDTVEGEYERSGYNRISSQKDLGMAINEATYDEKKICQQIDAMRIILGYKAAKQVTCFEELKALYIFTGVEPPSSFKDPSDLLEINAKLRFLMSVIGVK